MGIRARLLLGVLVILLPAIALQHLEYEQARERRRSMALQTLEQTATVGVALVESRLESLRAVAVTVADEVEERQLEGEALQTELKRMVRFRPHLANVGVFDATGTQLAAAHAAPPGRPVNLADRRYFVETLRTRKPVLSGVLKGRLLDRPMVVAASPIVTPSGELDGVVTVSLDVATLREPVDESGGKNTRGMFVLDQDGVLVFHTLAPQGTFGADWSAVPEVRRALAGETVRSTSFRSPLFGDVRVAALVPSRDTGWVVGMAWSAEDAFQEIDAAHRQHVLLLTAVALFATLGALVLATLLTRPIHALARAAEAYGAGHRDVRIVVNTGDELDTLARAFNHMADALAEERRKRETFVAAIMHDMRNVLTPLKAGAQLLRRTAASLDERQQRIVDGLVSQTRHIERLITDVGDFGHIEAGTFRIVRKREDL
ncbi:MAG: cache domain-containing protein, partial [Myxococcales bacterium]